MDGYAPPLFGVFIVETIQRVRTSGGVWCSFRPPLDVLIRSRRLIEVFETYHLLYHRETETRWSDMMFQYS